MQCSNIDLMEDGAFDSSAFKTVEKLTLSFASSGNMLTAQSLSGLSQLKILHFADSSMSRIQRGSINIIAGTLEELIFRESSTYNSKIIITGLTGGNPLSHLTNVKIQRNMMDTITNDTFSALVNVIRLDLSYCQIEIITAGAFAPISNTIQELNLRNNKLAQIPAGLLDRLVINPAVTINLEANQWRCNCELCYLRWLIRNGKLTKLNCRQPIEYRDDDIGDGDFCPDAQQCDVYTLEETPTIITTTTTTEDPNSIEDPNNQTDPPNSEEETNVDQFYKQQCSRRPNSSAETHTPSDDFVMLPKHSHQFKFLRTSNSTVAVLVESRICNMFLLWFDSTREMYRTPTLSEAQAYGCTYLADTLNRTTNFQQVIMIDTLLANVPYVFCLMERTSTTVSPLNCMPYMNVVLPTVDIDDDDVYWLLGSDKTMQIAFVVIIMLSCVMVGFFVAYLLLRRRTKQLEADAMKGYRNKSVSFDAGSVSTDYGKQANG